MMQQEPQIDRQGESSLTERLSSAELKSLLHQVLVLDFKKIEERDDGGNKVQISELKEIRARLIQNAEKALQLQWNENVFRASEEFAKVIFACACFLSIPFGGWLLVWGFGAIGSGLVAVFNNDFKFKEEDLKACATGIELILLAPLPYLVCRALSAYVIEGDSANHNNANHAKIALLNAKALVMGLLASAVATHLVGQLGASQTESKAGLSIGEKLAIFGAIAGIYILMELGVHWLKRKAGKT